MKKNLVLAALVTGAALTVGGAHADPPSVAGFTCGFTSTDDGGNGILQPNEQFGEIDGGPFAVADVTEATDNPGGGDIVCSINVNTDSYLAPHAASATSQGVANLDNDVVIYLPPTPISYIAAPGSNVYICTGLWYRDAWGNYVHVVYDYTPDPTDPSGQTSLGFTSDMNAAKCGLAISTG